MYSRIAGAAAAIASSLVVLAGPGTAWATVVDQTFSSQQPASPTHALGHIVYPNGPDGRPKMVREADYTFPAGTTVDQGAVPTCEASDPEIYLLGLAACPPDTQLGGGKLTAVTGCGGPLQEFSTDIHSFHGPSQLLNMFTPAGAPGPVLAIARISIQGDRFIDKPTLPPGCPSAHGGENAPIGHSAPTEVFLDIGARSPAGQSFLTTPTPCPAGGWVFGAVFHYTDGSTDNMHSTSPCRHGATRER